MRCDSKVFDVAARQHGLITRAQLSQVEGARGLWRGLVRAGVVEPVGRQTFRIVGAPRTDHQRVMAACLDVGGWASHRTGAWLHGSSGFAVPALPEVVVGRRSFSYDHELCTVHTSTNLSADDLVVVDGIPVLSVARMLFSLASMVPALPYDRVKGAVDEAVARRIAHDPWLWARLEAIRCRGRNGVSVFERILVERSGGAVTESWLERETLRLIDGAGLPRPVCQGKIGSSGAFVARVDFVNPAERVVIEVLGHAWHSTRAQVGADAARRRRLVLEGYVVLDFTYDDVVHRPGEVVAQIAAALRTRRDLVA